MSPREQKAEQRRQDILHAALAVFAEKGYHAAGIADIATLLGIGHGTFYRYFANKRAIFDALVSSTIAGIAAVMHDEPPTTNTLAEYEQQLYRIAGRLFMLFAADVRQSRILLFEAPGVDAELHRQFQAAMAGFALLTEQYLLNGQRKAFLRAMDTGIGARAINAVIIEGIREVCFSAEPQQEARRWTEQGVPMMLRGIGA